MPNDSKQLAMNLFETNRKEFLTYARWVAERICRVKGHVTTDDVREEIGLPKDLDGRVYGAVFNRKDWRKVSYTQTKIKSSHGRPIAIFTLSGGVINCPQINNY